MQLAAKVAYNTIIQIAGKIVSTVLGLLAIAIITRSLGQTGFGQYTTVITFMSFFAILADLGLTLVTVQLISTARDKEEEERILGNLLGLRIVSALLFIGLGPVLILFFPYDFSVKLGAAVISLSFLFIALNQIFVGLFQKYLRLDKVAIAEVAGRAFLLIAVLFALKLDTGLTGVLAATSVSGALGFFLHWFFSRRFARIKILFESRYWRMIIAKSWPLAITIFFNLIYLKTDILLLSLIKRPSQIGIFAEVGIYGASYKVIDALITLPFIFAGIILPILTARWSKNDNAGFKNVLQKSFDLMAIIALPLVIGAHFTAGQIMTIIAGQEFAASGPVLEILIYASLFVFLGCIFSHAVIALDQQKKIIGAYVFTAVTAVVGYFIFIPVYSYFGAAWVTIYSELAIAFAAFYLVRKYSGFTLKFNVFLKSLAACGLMALFLYAIKNALTDNLLVLLLVGVLTYLPALYLFKAVTKNDLMILTNKNS